MNRSCYWYRIDIVYTLTAASVSSVGTSPQHAITTNNNNLNDKKTKQNITIWFAILIVRCPSKYAKTLIVCNINRNANIVCLSCTYLSDVFDCSVHIEILRSGLFALEIVSIENVMMTNRGLKLDYQRRRHWRSCESADRCRWRRAMYWHPAANTLESPRPVSRKRKIKTKSF